MPERESASPQHDPDARLGDLFENLPDPTPQIPTVDNTPPPPGSRRAAREAATNGATLPADDSSGESQGGPSDEDTATRAFPITGGAAGADAAPTGAATDPDAAREASAGAGTTGEAASSSTASRGDGVSDPAVAATSTAVPGARLEDLFHAPPEDDAGSRPPKKKRRKGCLVALIIVLAVLGGIAAGGVWAWNTFGDKISDALGWGEPADWEAGQATGEVLVTIKEGDTGAPVSTALHEAGVTRTDEVFYDYLVKENVAVTFYPGIYRLQEKMTAAAALEAIQNPDNKLEHSASIGEGATIESSLPGMAESLGMPIEDLQAAVDADPASYGVNAPSLEGWLFPAVYTFDPDVTATQVIQRMVDRTNESLNAAGVPAEDAERILTIASIIQREGRTADFAKVSRVIQNRLDIDMKLQMDSTAQYGYGSLHEGVVSSSAEALEDPNDWNTYVHTGLPVTPIASPSDAAIKAAMNPEDGPWLYFVTINLATGETQFSETYEEHLQGVAKWEQWCQENPDGGCSAG
ncbi:endolytic transglycosylase MltG [Microbacterium foliorum]|uniref:endolytic transglycosylase MltG n=1 Tax=Microbacterium foliorum TaxID=104336 RepID=UPI001DCCF164|nr:endolytic transglycosylase MltG [Microbacterium foliorum]CAH0142557.1 Endolytic murein transglycosylase [Microbacterium foliorum]CAH0159515.1 Endolytic murein transglycosylase [Microbacterium foliorum]